METLTQKQTQPQPERVTGDGSRERAILPPVNISAGKDEYLLEVEMPGVNKDGLEVSVEGNELTIAGRRQPDSFTGEVVYRESSDAGYRRVFEISSDIDTGKITAEMNQGILRLHLPKAERVKPRQIKIAD
jgi:HSP20 family protein